MADQTAIPPPVMWAQRSAVIFLTINVEDVNDPTIGFTKDSVYFKGTGGVEKKNYEVTIPLYKEIDVDKSKSFNRERCIEMVLAKANRDDPFWPTLTSDKSKHHWLKCDFNKWQDEDESGDEGLGGMGGGGKDYMSMLNQMNYMDNDEGGEENDSDDEVIPDLE